VVTAFLVYSTVSPNPSQSGQLMIPKDLHFKQSPSE
jgi:hypothetical protein